MDNHGPRRARGSLEAQVMGVLWAAQGPMTASAVQAMLGDGLAHNTVQTTLTRLHEKKQLRRERVGRAHTYWPVLNAAAAAAARMQAALDERRDRTAVLQQFAASLDDEAADVLHELLSFTRCRRRA
ncbi:BlaI/MecI/CopY family transcriptional regulator [Krasilnikovia sp. MM14-A1004]|uniref:BlaI/MecI/CopY family transcriptional regulator n=1 Tax=Krasilnikovia sp. MM14-A1004 TaxID=3373541 RepID=UPI00399C911D